MRVVQGLAISVSEDYGVATAVYQQQLGWSHSTSKVEPAGNIALLFFMQNKSVLIKSRPRASEDIRVGDWVNPKSDALDHSAISPY